MIRMAWEKIPHPHYDRLEKLVPKNIRQFPRLPYSPKWQYKYLGMSIISPSDITFGQWELFDGKEIYRFDQLKQAKEFGEELINRKNG